MGLRLRAARHRPVVHRRLAVGAARSRLVEAARSRPAEAARRTNARRVRRSAAASVCSLTRKSAAGRTTAFRVPRLSPMPSAPAAVQRATSPAPQATRRRMELAFRLRSTRVPHVESHATRPIPPVSSHASTTACSLVDRVRAIPPRNAASATSDSALRAWGPSRVSRANRPRDSRERSAVEDSLLECGERTFLEALDELQIRYLIVGVGAAVMQGAPLVTQDRSDPREPCERKRQIRC